MREGDNAATRGINVCNKLSSKRTAMSRVGYPAFIKPSPFFRSNFVVFLRFIDCRSWSYTYLRVAYFTCFVCECGNFCFVFCWEWSGRRETDCSPSYVCSVSSPLFLIQCVVAIYVFFVGDTHIKRTTILPLILLINTKPSPSAGKNTQQRTKRENNCTVSQAARNNLNVNYSS